MEKGYKKIFVLFFIVILLTVNFTTVFSPGDPPHVQSPNPDTIVDANKC